VIIALARRFLIMSRIKRAMCELLHIVRPNLPVESCKIGHAARSRHRYASYRRLPVVRDFPVSCGMLTKSFGPPHRSVGDSPRPISFLLWRILVTSRGHRVQFGDYVGKKRSARNTIVFMETISDVYIHAQPQSGSTQSFRRSD
jgi:hypothetical protein